MNHGTDIPLVLGAGGRLGGALHDAMTEAYPAASFATRFEVDITDRWRVEAEVERLEATIIVNTASLTHVDGCEREPALSDAVNRQGAENVARAAREIGARLVHVSTDFVFDGASRRHYVEEDPTGPLSVYGQSKLAGEEAVLAECPEATILRVSWLFGRGEGKFPENFLSMIAEGRPLSLVADRYGSPTYIPDIAEAILRLLRVPYSGILHFTNTGEKSTRYDFVKRAAELCGLDLAAVRPVSQAEWHGDLARRPLNSALDPSRFIQVTGWTPRSWEEALEAYVRTRTGSD